MPTRESLVIVPNVPIVNVTVDPLKYDNLTNARTTGQTEETRSDEIIRNERPDQRLVKSPSRSNSPRPLYNDITSVRIHSGSLGALYPESKFIGYQKSGRSQYEVDIRIKQVDLREKILSGFLHIRNLSDQDITTFFTGEIISTSAEFFRNPYGVEVHIDAQHWSKFPALGPLVDNWANSYPDLPDQPYDFISNDFVYARWKERHLVPNHKEVVMGACYAGFYYVSYQKSTGSIVGWYYHKNSELLPLP